MEAYIGSIWSFGFNFAPAGWALCNGTLLPIANYTTLYSLIGTTYGGDGNTTFGLPNLQGRVPIGTGQGPGLSNYVIGQKAGNETVTLIANNLPAHTHPVLASSVPVSATNGELGIPTNAYFGLANTATGAVYANAAATGVTMAPNVNNSGSTGSSLPMDIMNPYLTVNYCICLDGLFPSRN